ALVGAAFRERTDVELWKNVLAALVPLALTVALFAGAWWYVTIHNAPAAAATSVTEPGALPPASAEKQEPPAAEKQEPPAEKEEAPQELGTGSASDSPASVAPEAAVELVGADFASTTDPSL